MSKVIIGTIIVLVGMVLGLVCADYAMGRYMTLNERQSSLVEAVNGSGEVELGQFEFDDEAVTTAEKLQHAQGIRHYEPTFNPQQAGVNTGKTHNPQ